MSCLEEPPQASNGRSFMALSLLARAPFTGLFKRVAPANDDLQDNALSKPSAPPHPHVATSHQEATRPFKRRKVAAQDTPVPRSNARPTASSTTSRSPNKSTKSRPVMATNTIHRYLLATNGALSDGTDTEPEPTPEPPVSLYETMQKTVHEAETKSKDKRTLRSHDEGGRLKSELATYFPQYEDIINDKPKEKELFNADTILIVRDHPQQPNHASAAAPADVASNMSKKRRRSSAISQNGLNGSSTAGAKSLGFERIVFTDIEEVLPHHPTDPLSDDHFFKAHRKAERKEKQLRNIEREKAMHEKVQLDRLLEGLQGHDWLRVMGVTGATDGEMQRFEVKRDYFIGEVQFLVNKFKEWRDEEKRIKAGKPANGVVNGVTKMDDDADTVAGAAEWQSEREASSSQIDVQSAMQLHQETSGGTRKKLKRSAEANVPPIVFREPTPDGPFTSFYGKPHLRMAALSDNRHGSNVLAFGQPVPEPEETAFSLPDGYISPDSLKESARRRRRMKRESVANSNA